MCREIWIVYWALLQPDVLIRSFKVVCLVAGGALDSPDQLLRWQCAASQLILHAAGWITNREFFGTRLRWTMRPLRSCWWCCWNAGRPLCSSITAWLWTASASVTGPQLKVKKITFKWKKKIYLWKALHWIGESRFRERLVEFSIIHGVDAKVVVLGPIRAGWCHITRGFFFFRASMGFPSKAPKTSITLLAPLNCW